MAIESLRKRVLQDLQAALHCHACGAFTPFWSKRYGGGEFCSLACWAPDLGAKRPCAFGPECLWCTDLVYQPFVPAVQQLLNAWTDAATVRTIRALDAFLEEHDSLPREKQYIFRMKEAALFHSGYKHQAFVARWYWSYVFGIKPKRGTLPSHWLDYVKFMPLPRRVSSAEWPFYE